MTSWGRDSPQASDLPVPGFLRPTPRPGLAGENRPTHASEERGQLSVQPRSRERRAARGTRSPPLPAAADAPGRPAAELAAAEPRAGRNKGPIQPRGWERVLIKALAADVGAEVLFLMEKQAFAVMC